MIQCEIFSPYQKEPKHILRKDKDTGKLVKEELPRDPRNIMRTYSDEGLQIRKVGTDEVHIAGEAFDLDDRLPEYEELPLAAETEAM